MPQRLATSGVMPGLYISELHSPIILSAYLSQQTTSESQYDPFAGFSGKANVRRGGVEPPLSPTGTAEDAR